MRPFLKLDRPVTVKPTDFRCFKHRYGNLFSLQTVGERERERARERERERYLAIQDPKYYM